MQEILDKYVGDIDNSTEILNNLMDGDVELTIYYDSVNNMVIIHDVNKSDDILLVTYSFDTKKRDENVIEYSRVVEGMPVVWSFKNNFLKTNE